MAVTGNSGAEVLSSDGDEQAARIEKSHYKSGFEQGVALSKGLLTRPDLHIPEIRQSVKRSIQKDISRYERARDDILKAVKQVGMNDSYRNNLARINGTLDGLRSMLSKYRID